MANQSQRFDLVFAATAWQWIDPQTRYLLAYRLLRPGGHLAFWKAMHAFPADFDPLFAEMTDLRRPVLDSLDALAREDARRMIAAALRAEEPTDGYDATGTRSFMWRKPLPTRSLRRAAPASSPSQH